MASFARSDLECMKRADIQRLCKDYGLKANLKTESLIELLLDNVQNSNLPPIADDHKRKLMTSVAPRRVSARSRAASGSQPNQMRTTRSASGRHTVLEDIATTSASQDAIVTQDHTEAVTNSQRVSPSVAKPRKAKETQYRLGVGRPTIAGGSGARAITKSRSITRKPPRTRSKRVAEPIERTIFEEHEPPSTPTSIVDKLEPNLPTPSSGRQNATYESPVRVQSSELSEPDTSEHDNHVIKSDQLNDEVHRLRDLVNSQQGVISKLQEDIRAMHSQVIMLRSEMSRMATIEGDLKALRDIVDQRHRDFSIAPVLDEIMVHDDSGKKSEKSRPPLPLAHSNTNISSRTDSLRSALASVQPQSPSIARTSPVNPRPLPLLLGKRHRDPNIGDVTPGIDFSNDDDVAGERSIIRPPPKKKSRVETEEAEQFQDLSNSNSEAAHPEASNDVTSPDVAAESQHTPADSPPPQTPLPSFYGEDIAQDGLHSLDFIFSAPTTSTPHAGSNGHDIWNPQELTFSPGSAVRSMRSHNGPASLLPTRELNGYDRQYQQLVAQPFAGTTMNIGAQEPFGALEMASVARPDDSPVAGARFSIYGTELENDGRYGDNAYEGVVRNMTDFWLAGQF